MVDTQLRGQGLSAVLAIRRALARIAEGRSSVALLMASIGLLALVAINCVGLAQTFLWLVRYGGGGDWIVLQLLSADDPYAVGGFRWSPPAAWIWATAVVPLGLPLWQLFHLAALALIRDWRVIAIALLSWAFWQDVANGNVMTFVVVSAWWALRGNPAGMVTYLALSVLIPRPLMIPVLIWLLWKRASARFWFVGFAALVVVLAILSGQFGDWVERMIVTGRDELASIWNIGASRLLGPVWIPIGILSAAVLAWKGWLGLASIVISPYLFPYYGLMGLLDVPRLLGDRQVTAAPARDSHSSA